MCFSSRVAWFLSLSSFAKYELELYCCVLLVLFLVQCFSSVIRLLCDWFKLTSSRIGDCPEVRLEIDSASIVSLVSSSFGLVCPSDCCFLSSWVFNAVKVRYFFIFVKIILLVSHQKIDATFVERVCFSSRLLGSYL